MFVDWTLCPNNVTFDFDSGYLPPALGRKPTRNRSPNWFVSFRFPEGTDDKRRLLDGLICQSPEGKSNITDPTRPYPKYWEKTIRRTKTDPFSIIPELSVSGINALNKTLQVQGENLDKITVGDPLAFTYEGLRYYFRAGADLLLNGAVQDLSVIYDPIRTLVFSVAVTADRINPTMRFAVNLNAITRSTGLGNLTQFGELQGVEWTHAV